MRRSPRSSAILFPLLAMALTAVGCASTGPPAGPAPSPAAHPAASDATAALQRIALGSCAEQTQPQPVWDAVLTARPDLFLMVGDNIYADTTDADELARAYAALGEVPGFAELRRRTPVLATWDDHDYGANDAGAELPGKERSKTALLDFFQVPEDAAVRHRPGLYQARTFGPPGRRVQVILLDTRWFRSPLELDPSPHFRYRPSLDAGATMLGAAQWEWLEERLGEPAEVRLLVSSVRVLGYASGFEGWKTLPLEQERLFALLRRVRAAGVVLLSGDAHYAELRRGDGGLGYPLYELTSSALNLPNPRGAARAAPLALYPPFGEPNFGLVELVWAPEPAVILETRDVTGQTVFRHTIPLRDLQPPDERID